MGTPVSVPAAMPLAGTAGLQGATNSEESAISGASRIKWGALLGVLGLALGIGGVLIVLLNVGLGITNVSNAGYVSILNTIFAAVMIIVAGVFLALLSFVLYTAGFASLRKVDSRFRVPMVLGILGLVGLLLIGLFVIFYASAIHTAIACSPTDLTCQNNATSLPPSIVPVGYLGGILGFIGVIGMILGLYRFGARYKSGVTRVGAILYFIPFVAILAPLLVLIGAHQIHRTLRQSPVPSAPVPAVPPS